MEKKKIDINEAAPKRNDFPSQPTNKYALYAGSSIGRQRIVNSAALKSPYCG
jgi:hypothetical protein